MKTIINFFKWLFSLFAKKQIKEIHETQTNIYSGYDSKYSGKRRFTKVPAI